MPPLNTFFPSTPPPLAQDNAASSAPDSRTFGPVPLSALLGRVLYAARGAADHGPVLNSVEAMAMDEAILEAELDGERGWGWVGVSEAWAFLCRCMSYARRGGPRPGAQLR